MRKLQRISRSAARGAFIHVGGRFKVFACPACEKSGIGDALAAIGALNFIVGTRSTHRRDALWQIERAARRFRTPFRGYRRIRGTIRKPPWMIQRNRHRDSAAGTMSPLLPMTVEERLIADFDGTGMTVGPHPMAYHRAEMKWRGIRSACQSLLSLPMEISSARSWIGNCAAAARHRQGLRVREPGR